MGPEGLAVWAGSSHTHLHTVLAKEVNVPRSGARASRLAVVPPGTHEPHCRMHLLASRTPGPTSQLSLGGL